MNDVFLRLKKWWRASRENPKRARALVTSEPEMVLDEPLSDGWFRRPNGEKYRPGCGTLGTEMLTDDEPGPEHRRQSNSLTRPFGGRRNENER